MAYATGINKLFLHIIESLCICAVNLYILISGYYLFTTQKRTLSKIALLIIQLEVFSVAFYLLKLLLQKEVFNWTGLILSILPVNYFVVLYSVTYIFSPVVNIYINNVSNKAAKKTLFIICLLFSIYPTSVDLIQELFYTEIFGFSSIGMYGSQWGYSIVNFLMMYYIGAYLRKYPLKLDAVRSFVCIWGLVLVITCWSFINEVTGYFKERSAWEYCNPFVILLTVAVFTFFLNIRIKKSVIINHLAKATYTAFLIHGYFLDFINIEYFVRLNPFLMVAHLIISSLFIYLICWVVYKIYCLVEQWFLKPVIASNKFLNHDIYAECFKESKM